VRTFRAYRPGVGQVLYQSEYYVLEKRPDAIHLERTSTPFPDLGVLESESIAVCAELDPYRHTAMVMDLRRAVGRNDPEFESKMKVLRPNLTRGFPRVAIVVSSVIGRMHVERHMREDQVSALVTLDESEALQYVSKS
jgi:hypothetical protein